jgi:hypothetical protein
MKLVGIYYSPIENKIELLSAVKGGIMFLSNREDMYTVVSENLARRTLIKYEYQFIGAFYEN